MSNAPATVADLARIEQRLARIEATIDAIADRVVAKLRAANAVSSSDDVIDLAEAQRMLGAGSPRALYRLLAKLKVRRISHGRYRRGDIENAIARATLPTRRA